VGRRKLEKWGAGIEVGKREMASLSIGWTCIDKFDWVMLASGEYAFAHDGRLGASLADR